MMKLMLLNAVHFEGLGFSVKKIQAIQFRKAINKCD